MVAMYVGEKQTPHGELPAIGVLLANLGTPDAPTAPALKVYLREFLSDPRVIELPRWKWKIILNLFVLTTRPAKSAEAYKEVWTDEGSPLLLIARGQARKVAALLHEKYGNPVHVELGMRYGNPSIESALDKLQEKSCRRIVVLPLYPQYSATTTASTFDAVVAALGKRRWVPELRTIHQYHDEPLYIDALARSIREKWDADGEPEKLLFSFHGIPQRYFDHGDPYFCHCQKTARLVAEALQLADDQWQVCFQSRFGKEPWLQPYTDETLKAWGKAGLKSVDVVCPGFSADCLETIEEIDQENREYFEEAGGGQYRYLPCLNERDDHAAALAAVLDRNLGGWAIEKAAWNEDAARAEAAASKKRADAFES